MTLTFSLKKQKIRKITIHNSVRYIPPTNSAQYENSHDHKPKTVSIPRKQNKKLFTQQ